MKLSERVARLEEAAAAGLLRGRDLDVIRQQLARAEAKLLQVAHPGKRCQKD